MFAQGAYAPTNEVTDAEFGVLLAFFTACVTPVAVAVVLLLS